MKTTYLHNIAPRWVRTRRFPIVDFIVL